MSDRIEFYQAHLNRVSRSFAFCIERLQSPLRAQISLSYLICRILDSVEDAQWPDREAQRRQFENFDRLLTAPFSDAEMQRWVESFPPGLPEGERLLLPESGSILRDLQQLPPKVREAITEPVLSMSRGMRYFATRQGEAPLRLHSLTEVDQYCFFVAGVVGEILTRLVALADGSGQTDENTLFDAFHFGLFLQKVNILKDQMGDEKCGRFLVPSRPEVLLSMREHARRAIDYVTSIPEHMLAYRLFCSWSLFLGLASLPFIEMSWQEQKPIKISRGATQILLAEVESVVGDNERLRQMFEDMFSSSGVAEAPWSEGQKLATAVGSEFPRLYRGRLSSDYLKVFGLS